VVRPGAIVLRAKQGRGERYRLFAATGLRRNTCSLIP
jgi:hypothetical protein